MVTITTGVACIYICVCLTILTLIIALMALYILIAKFEETGMRAWKEEHQESRPDRPISLPRL